MYVCFCYIDFDFSPTFREVSGDHVIFPQSHLWRSAFTRRLVSVQGKIIFILAQLGKAVAVESIFYQTVIIPLLRLLRTYKINSWDRMGTSANWYQRRVYHIVENPICVRRKRGKNTISWRWECKYFQEVE